MRGVRNRDMIHPRAVFSPRAGNPRLAPRRIAHEFAEFGAARGVGVIDDPSFVVSVEPWSLIGVFGSSLALWPEAIGTAANPQQLEVLLQVLCHEPGGRSKHGLMASVRSVRRNGFALAIVCEG